MFHGICITLFKAKCCFLSIFAQFSNDFALIFKCIQFSACPDWLMHFVGLSGLVGSFGLNSHLLLSSLHFKPQITYQETGTVKKMQFSIEYLRYGLYLLPPLHNFQTSTRTRQTRITCSFRGAVGSSSMVGGDHSFNALLNEPHVLTILCALLRHNLVAKSEGPPPHESLNVSYGSNVSSVEEQTASWFPNSAVH